jgi:hypothetical protein
VALNPFGDRSISVPAPHFPGTNVTVIWVSLSTRTFSAAISTASAPPGFVQDAVVPTLKLLPVTVTAVSASPAATGLVALIFGGVRVKRVS